MASYRKAVALLVDDLEAFLDTERTFEETKEAYSSTGDEDLYYSLANLEATTEWFDNLFNEKAYLVACLFNKDHKKVKDDVYRLHRKQQKDKR